MRVLKRIVLLEEGPSGPRRTITKEWQSQTHVRWVGKYDGTIVPRYREKAIYGAHRVWAMRFDERSAQQPIQDQKTVRSRKTKMLQCSIGHAMAPFRGLPHTTGSAGGFDWLVASMGRTDVTGSK